MAGRTTAHLAPPCDDLLSELIGLRGEEPARLHHRSHAAAVDRIEELVQRHGIDCAFRRVEGHLFPALGTPEKDARKQIDKEFEAASKLGVEVERGRGVPLEGLGEVPILRYPRQATFHPLRYLEALARLASERGARCIITELANHGLGDILACAVYAEVSHGDRLGETFYGQRVRG